MIVSNKLAQKGCNNQRQIDRGADLPIINSEKQKYKNTTELQKTATKGSHHLKTLFYEKVS